MSVKENSASRGTTARRNSGIPQTAAHSEALKVKDGKEWFLNNQNPGVQDPTLPDAWLPISAAVDLYVDSLTRCKRTKSAYGHAVREFEAWNSSLKNGGKKTFVEEIDKVHLGVAVAHRSLRGGATASAFFSQLSQRYRSGGNLQRVFALCDSRSPALRPHQFVARGHGLARAN
jgi:hypothetical protein